MNEKGKNIVKFELKVPWLALLFAIITFIFYGLKAAFIVGVLGYLGMSLLPLLGFVPIAGPFLYIMAFNWLQNGLLGLVSGLEPNFFFTLIFLIGLAFSILFTAIATFVAAIFLLAIIAGAKGW